MTINMDCDDKDGSIANICEANVSNLSINRVSSSAAHCAQRSCVTWNGCGKTQTVKLGLDRYSEMIWRQFFEREFIDISGKKILDIGCGDGRYTEQLADNNDYIGLDISVKWMTSVVSKAESIPFASESFDEVIGIGILDYSDPQWTLIEAYRAMKPGGTLRIMVPNICNPYHLTAYFSNKKYGKRAFYLRDIYHMVWNAGFDPEIVFEDGFCFYVPGKWFQELFIPIYKFLNEIFGGIMGNNIYIRAKKPLTIKTGHCGDIYC